MAAAQPHRIQRQVLEVAGAERASAQAAGDALRTLFQQRLLPVIDAACDAAAGPERLLRIDRVEIDLGAEPWEQPQQAVERLARVLAQRLAADADAAVPAPDSHVELLARFALTATLPWWADPADRGLIAAAIERALAAPAAARGLLRELAGRPDAWRRLLPHGDDPCWDAWLALALPGWPRLAGAPLQALAKLVGDASAASLRARWWPPLLAAAGAAGVRTPALIGDALLALAQQTERDVAALWADWRDASAPHGTTLGGHAVALDRLFAAPAPAAADFRPDAGDSRVAERLSPLAQSPAGRALWGRLAAVLQRLPPALRRAAADGGAPSTFAALVGTALAQGLIGPEAVDDWIAAAAGAADAPPALLAALRTLPRRGARPLPQDDTLAVGNAGIVLLWPFLGRFFEHLELVVERQFTGDGAAQRAARLLHFIASGDPEPVEYQLPLCKLLCGLDLLAPIDAEEPVDAADQAQSEALLQAVIAQAPVLREMSIDGFRGSFLLRRGQLGARDDHHLLRVEREGWDIVIERFPWTAAVVRLPWMSTVLHVQW